MHWKAYTLGLVCVVSVCVIGGQGVTVGVAQQGTAADGYAVVQERACYEIEPLGDGSQSVAAFYDYQSGPNSSFSSAGTRTLQVSQGSQFFLYEGREGLSLVFLHDRLDDGRGGGALSVDIAGLPESGTWVVEDDNYRPTTDDRFRHDGTTSTIDWMWAPNRTDGAAFRGLGTESVEITVEPTWGENAWAVTGRTPPFPFGDDDTTRWFVRGADGTRDLEKSAPVTIRSGGCDRTAPATTLSSTTNETVPGENVTLDASGTTDDSPIVAYRWDVDGDGTVDRTTDEPTVTVAFDEPAVYRPTVIAEDRFRNNGTANVTVAVAEPSQPTVGSDDGDTAPDEGSDSQRADESDITGESDPLDRSNRRNTGGGGGGASAGTSSVDRRIPNTQPIAQQQPGMRLSYRQVGPDRFIATVRNATQRTTVARETPGNVGETGKEAELRAMAFTATADRSLYRLNVTVNGSSGVDAGTTRIDDELVVVYPEVQPASDIGADTFELTYVFDVDRDRLRELGVSRSNIVVATLENGQWRQREAVVSPSGSELVVNATVGAPKPAVFGLQRANLTVTNVSTGTPSVVRGQSTLFTVRLQNDGHRDARERIRLRAGARTILDRTVSVPARSRRNLTTRVRFVRAGERELRVLDYERPLEVVPPRPDMVVTDVRLERERIRPGETATIHATVRNRGSAAGTARLSVSAFGTVVGTKAVDLQPGSSRNVSYSQRIESAGTYELGINGTTRQVVVEGNDGGGATPADAASEPVSSGGPFSDSVVAVLVGLALFLLVSVIVVATVWE